MIIPSAARKYQEEIKKLFGSANDFLEHYKEFLIDKNNNFNEYDKYALKLLENLHTI